MNHYPLIEQLIDYSPIEQKIAIAILRGMLFPDIWTRKNRCVGKLLELFEKKLRLRWHSNQRFQNQLRAKFIIRPRKRPKNQFVVQKWRPRRPNGTQNGARPAWPAIWSHSELPNGKFGMPAGQPAGRPPCQARPTGDPPVLNCEHQLSKLFEHHCVLRGLALPGI